MQKKSERKGWGSGEVRKRRKRMGETRREGKEESRKIREKERREGKKKGGS